MSLEQLSYLAQMVGSVGVVISLMFVGLQIKQNTRALDPSYGLKHIDDALRPHGLGDSWSFVNYDGSYHGAARDRVVEFAASADLFINLSLVDDIRA